MDYLEHLEQISRRGYTVIDQFLPATSTENIASELISLKVNQAMKSAGISQQGMVNHQIRGDFIHWLEIERCSAAQGVYLQKMDELRQRFNQDFFLSLTEFECHLAAYPIGAVYQKHLDQFQSAQHRKISAVFYLNQDWLADDGGELRLYLDGNQPEPYIDITPNAGKLVLFDSSRFWHEVLPAKRERLSMTGWFRTRSEII